MKKIQSQSDYFSLAQIVEEAENSLHTNENVGIHYTLAWILRGFGITSTTRENTVQMGKQLLKSYEMEMKNE